MKLAIGGLTEIWESKMLQSVTSTKPSAAQAVIERVRAIIPMFTARATQAEDARSIPRDSVQELLDAGIARVLMPLKFGGYELGMDTWFDIVLEISRVDTSHGWCASLITHHAHVVAQFPEQAQRTIWANGPDVAIAASIMPTTQVTRADGGYVISGRQSAFASGVNHCSWAFVGGYLDDDDGQREWTLFLIPREKFSIEDTWLTAGMRGTGSNTIITDNVFVPSAHTLKLADLRDGCAFGAGNRNPLFQIPFFYYAPLTFVTPMLGAVQGAYEYYRQWAKARKSATTASVQIRMARAAADLDAAELLLRRGLQLTQAPNWLSPKLLARSVRDFARSAEMVVAAIDTLMSLCGTAGFAVSNPIQRVWRDVHFASMHVSLNADNNYGHFGRSEFDLPRDPAQPFF